MHAASQAAVMVVTQPVLHGTVLQCTKRAEQLLVVWSQSEEDHADVRAQAGAGLVSAHIMGGNAKAPLHRRER